MQRPISNYIEGDVGDAVLTEVILELSGYMEDFIRILDEQTLPVLRG